MSNAGGPDVRFETDMVTIHAQALIALGPAISPTIQHIFNMYIFLTSTRLVELEISKIRLCA